MNKTTSSLSQGFLSVLLILSLVLPSLALPSIAMAQQGASSGEEDGSGLDDGGKDPDTDGDGVSDSAEADANQANADAVAAAAAAANVDVNVESVDTSKNASVANNSVSVNGKTMSVDQANAAISALAAAGKAGLMDSVDVNATLGKYADNAACSGCVVGKETGVMGSPQAVAHAEIDAAIGKVNASKTTSATMLGSKVNVLSTTLAAPKSVLAPLSIADDIVFMFDLAKQVEPKSVITTSFTPTANVHVDIPDNIVEAYNQFAQSAKAAQISGIGDNDPNVTYSYDPAKAGWVGDKNGKMANPNTFNPTVTGMIDQLAGLGTTPNTSVTIDTYNDTVTVTDTATGKSVTKSSLEIASLAADNKSVTGQEYGKSYAGPKGGPNGLNLAAQYAAVVYANQQVTPIKSINVEEDAKIMAAIAVFEGPKNTQTLSMEVMANRALAAGNKPGAIKADATTKNAYQPVTDLAKSLCGCKSPTQAQMQQALNSIVAQAQKSKTFATNVEIAKSIINGTHVRSAITSTQLGFVNFANVPVTISQGKATQATIGKNVAMKDDPESITVNPGKYNEQTYGIIAGSKAPSFSPTTTSFDPNSVADTHTNSTVYGGNTGGGAATPATGGNTGSGNTGGGTGTTGGNNSSGGQGGSTPSGNQDSRSGLIDSLADALSSLLGGNSTNNPTPTESHGGGTCPPYPVPCQGSAASHQSSTTDISGRDLVGLTWLSQEEGASAGMFESMFNWLWRWLISDDNSLYSNAIYNIPSYVPVLITIDHQKKQVGIDRPDIYETLKDPTKYYNDEQLTILRKLFDETPFLTGPEGEILYSNGLYSPPIINGKKITDGVPKYVYSLEVIDENGEPVSIENANNNVPDGLLSTIVDRVLGNAAPFYFEDVVTVSYYKIDPDIKIAADEYYQYEIVLRNGSVRKTTVPEFFSVSFITKRLGQIGYIGDVMELVSMATENSQIKEEGFLPRWINRIEELFRGNTDETRIREGIFLELTNDQIPPTTIDGTGLERVFLYPVSDVPCAENVAGYEDGFMYVAVLSDVNNPGYDIVVSDGRCGTGTIEQIVAETTRHLKAAHKVDNLTYDSVYNNTYVIFEPTTFKSSITRVLADNPIETIVVLPSETDSDTSDGGTTPTTIPNLTNDIAFEVKAVGNDGKLLTDWTTAESITISSGVQLYFRWNGTAYQQCLPFLNDNGIYALKARGSTMVSGNTESEGYDVPETSATYRIECGGQRNNEYGVDDRKIEVTIQ